jgi:hypothetical protein
MSNTMGPRYVSAQRGRFDLPYGFGVTVVVLFTSTVVSVAA